MRTSFLIFYLFIGFQLVANDVVWDERHQHKYDSLVFADTLVIANIVSNHNTDWNMIYAQKNRLHYMQYIFENNRNNWLSANLFKKPKYNPRLEPDSNKLLNIRYSFGASDDHLFDINAHQTIGRHFVYTEFSRSSSISNFNNSKLSGRNFKLGTKGEVAQLQHHIYYHNLLWDFQENGGYKNIADFNQVTDVSSLTLFTHLNTAKNSVDQSLFKSDFIYSPFSLMQKDSINSKKTSNFIGIYFGYDYLKEGHEFRMNKNDIDSGFFVNNYFSNNKTLDSIGNLLHQPKFGIAAKHKSFDFLLNYQINLSPISDFEEQKIVFNTNYILNKSKHYNTIDYRVDGIWSGGYLITHQSDFDLANYILTFNYAYSNILPTYFYLKHISNHFIWNNSFKKEQISDFKISYKHNSLPFTFSLNYFNAQNYVYLNHQSLPTQSNTGANYINFNTHYLFKRKYYVSSNLIGFQQANSIIRVPNFYLKTTQSTNFKILGMPMSIGVSLFYTSKHSGMAYNPAIRHYYLQDTQKVGGFPLLDVFIAAKAGGADLFVKVENSLFNFLDRSSMLVYQNMITVPMFIRFGFNWRFID